MQEVVNSLFVSLQVGTVPPTKFQVKYKDLIVYWYSCTTSDSSELDEAS